MDKEKYTYEEHYQVCQEIINAGKKVLAANGGKDIVFTRGNYTYWSGREQGNAV